MWHFSDAAKLYVPIVDLGATNVAKTAPRTNRVAATAKISVLVDEIGMDERIVVRGGLVRLEEVLESTLCKRNKKVAKAAEAVLELLLSCGALRQHAKFNGCSRPSCPCGSSQKAGFAAQE